MLVRKLISFMMMLLLPVGGEAFVRPMPMTMTIYGGYRNKDCELTHLLMNRGNVEFLTQHSASLQKNTILYIATNPCPECDKLDKRLKNLSDSFPDISFLKLDARRDDYALLMYLQVSSFPYLLFYHEGERVSQHHVMDPERVPSLIQSFSEEYD